MDPETALDESEFFQDMHQFGVLLTRHSLAYAEMRLIIARLLFHFDIAPADAEDWAAKQKAYFLWAKSPLRVRITPRSV